MQYTFERFLSAIDTNWFEDDPLLERLLAHFAGARGRWTAQARTAMRDWGGRTAGLLRELAEESALPGNEPRLVQHDPYGNRVDRIVLPRSTLAALAEVEGREKLGSPAPDGDPFLFYARAYLYWQNGEAGVACSMGCTDGLVRVLEALGDRPEHAEAVRRVRGSSPERVWHGAQFVTEIQGGSDVPANEVAARPQGDAFRLYGRKWFCSNVNADYFVVTARPEGAPAGADGVGLFLVPAYLEEGTAARNGYTIDRLKEKLGTRELATAEVTFDGAVATPIGPLDRGLSNLLRHVLVPSRVACVISTAAFLRRAERIADAYTSFRTAFGRSIIEFPLVREQVLEIRRARARALAVVFALIHDWEAFTDEERRATDRATSFRIMLSLSKTVLTREATRLLHQAIMLLAANGIEERFSPLPRLFRDAVIMEVWEGPHNVLLTQALRDLVRFDVDAEAFVAGLTGTGDAELAGELRDVLRGAANPDATVALAALAPRLVHAWADRILREVGHAA